MSLDPYTRAQKQKKPTTKCPKSDECIKDVYAHNLREEMDAISELVEHFPYVSMDTEFPGVVVHPTGSFGVSGSYNHMWKTIPCNVNILKIIQLGLTFSDENGELPVDTCTWQFNFRFDIDSDMFAQDSIDLLTGSGIDFAKHKKEGIDVQDFGELLTTSGLVMNPNVKWISFHSGYDFGYLTNVLTNSDLPEEEDEFFDTMDTFFVTIYDIKYIMKSCSDLNHKAGLNALATDLRVERIGPCHQAGSDSLITCMTFFKLIRENVRGFSLQDPKWKNVLYGLGRDRM